MSSYFTFRDIYEINKKYLMTSSSSKAAEAFMNELFNLPRNQGGSTSSDYYRDTFCFKSDHISHLRNFERSSSIQDFHALEMEESELIASIQKMLKPGQKQNAYDDLSMRIKNAGNIPAAKKRPFQYQDTFEKLYAKLLLLFWESPSYFFKDELKAYYKKIDKENEIKTKAIKKTEKALAIIDDLRAVSKFMLDAIYQQEERYHATSIQPSLLSAGLEFHAHGTSDGVTKPLLDYFMDSEQNLYIEGDGGIGKTTFLIQLLKLCQDETYNAIPIFISLASLKEYALSSYNVQEKQTHCIVNLIADQVQHLKQLGVIPEASFDRTQFISQLHNLLTDTNQKTRILLLLDGINEISMQTNSNHRDRILNEIQRLSGFSNIRMVTVSRIFFDSDKYHLERETRIKALGITDVDLKTVLTEKHLPLPTTAKMSQILKTPLFLRMYLDICQTNENPSQDITSRGGLLYRFYNGTNSIYNEKNLQKLLKEDDPEIPDYLPFVLDFILPMIATEMQYQDTFEITYDYYFEIHEETLLHTIDLLSHLHDGPMASYNKGIKRITSYKDKLRDGEEVLNQIISRLGILYENFNGNLSFTHQYIRDYFASYYSIWSMYLYAQNSAAKYYLENIRNEHWSIEKKNLITEIAKDTEVQNLFGECLPYLALQNNKFTEASSTYIASENLFETLTTYTNNDLSDFTFEHLNLRGIPLTGLNLYSKDHSTKFIDCNFSYDSFFLNNRSCIIYEDYDFSEDQPCLYQFAVDQGYLIGRIINLASGLPLILRTLKLDSLEINETDIKNILLSPSNQYAFVLAKDNYKKYRGLFIWDLLNETPININIPYEYHIDAIFLNDNEILLWVRNYQFVVYDIAQQSCSEIYYTKHFKNSDSNHYMEISDHSILFVDEIIDDDTAKTYDYYLLDLSNDDYERKAFSINAHNQNRNVYTNMLTWNHYFFYVESACLYKVDIETGTQEMLCSHPILAISSLFSYDSLAGNAFIRLTMDGYLSINLETGNAQEYNVQADNHFPSDYDSQISPTFFAEHCASNEKYIILRLQADREQRAYIYNLETKQQILYRPQNDFQIFSIHPFDEDSILILYVTGIAMILDANDLTVKNSQALFLQTAIMDASFDPHHKRLLLHTKPYECSTDESVVYSFTFSENIWIQTKVLPSISYHKWRLINQGNFIVSYYQRQLSIYNATDFSLTDKLLLSTFSSKQISGMNVIADTIFILSPVSFGEKNEPILAKAKIGNNGKLSFLKYLKLPVCDMQKLPDSYHQIMLSGFFVSFIHTASKEKIQLKESYIEIDPKTKAEVGLYNDTKDNYLFAKFDLNQSSIYNPNIQVTFKLFDDINFDCEYCFTDKYDFERETLYFNVCKNDEVLRNTAFIPGGITYMNPYYDMTSGNIYVQTKDNHIMRINVNEPDDKISSKFIPATNLSKVKFENCRIDDVFKQKLIDSNAIIDP